jgi:hypothetical protein
MGAKKVTRAQILKGLSAKGIDTVPKLVDHMLALQKSQVQPISTIAALSKTQPAPVNPKKITYSAPKVPLFIDGAAVPGAEISKFNGKPLTLVVQSNPANGGLALHAFTSVDFMNQVKSMMLGGLVILSGGSAGGSPPPPGYNGPWPVVVPGPPPNPGQPPWPPPTPGWVAVYSDVNLHGDLLRVYNNQSIADLATVLRGNHFPNLDVTWNDAIMSQWPSSCDVFYYTDVNFYGTMVWVQHGIVVNDFTTLGFADAFSSISVGFVIGQVYP